ncbi:MAG: hypothetical protein HFE75_03415 [Firmicutes bacterium]|nr:hypothetical protein [Bacillota bacterium]
MSEVLNAISEQMILDPLKLNEFFWDMFIVDALVGNFDRHNGNWGFLVNEQELSLQCTTADHACILSFPMMRILS